MATIVVSVESGKRFVLIGSGYGAFRSEKPNAFLGNLFPDKTEGTMPVLCVCDESGTLGWIESDSVRVESVDGETPASRLKPR